MTTLSSILPPVSVSQVTGTLPVANGGTGATTLTGVVKGTGTAAFTAGTVDLMTEVTGTLPVANGGTGATTLTGVVKGTGTSALTAGTVSLTTEVSGTLPVGSGGTGSTTLTENNVLLGNGTSALQAVAPGTLGNVLRSNGTTWTSAALPPSGPTLTAVASGSLSDGSRVIINADGTVSVAAGAAASSGTPVVFRSANTTEISATYDVAANRVVIAYTDIGNSSFSTAVVGTVSGTSISFGTPVVFNSSNGSQLAITYNVAASRIVIAYDNTFPGGVGRAIVGTVSGTSISFGAPVQFSSSGPIWTAMTYDSVQQRVVIAYGNTGNSNFGTAIVGTVSGTSISFGGAVVFESAGTFTISATYDSAAQKVVLAYQDGGNSSFGTAIVGTVSGTSISFGSAVVFESATTFSISATYDSVQQRVVVAYQDIGNSSFGTAIVGTVSGTAISFGSVVVFNAAATSNVSVTYDVTAQSAVIIYRNDGNSNFGTAIFGTVSGTSISFGTPLVFASAISSSNSAIYNTNAQRVVVAYSNTSSSGFGTAVTVQAPTSNLTSENFIGFSNAAYTNGQTATIQIVGSVDDAQSGLTPGQSYFVQNDGTLGLTPGTPSVFAGTAVAATKIIVKG